MASCLGEEGFEEGAIDESKILCLEDQMSNKDKCAGCLCQEVEVATGACLDITCNCLSGKGNHVYLQNLI